MGDVVIPFVRLSALARMIVPALVIENVPSSHNVRVIRITLNLNDSTISPHIVRHDAKKWTWRGGHSVL